MTKIKTTMLNKSQAKIRKEAVRAIVEIAVSSCPGMNEGDEFFENPENELIVSNWIPNILIDVICSFLTNVVNPVDHQRMIDHIAECCKVSLKEEQEKE